MSSWDDDYYLPKAIKLNGVIYYNSEDGPHENHWDILARVVKELRASVEEQQKLLDDIDADRVPVEFGYPARTLTVPEGFTTISRDRQEYTDKARDNLDLPKPVQPVEQHEGYGLPGFDPDAICNCPRCRESREKEANEKLSADLLANPQTATI